MKKVSLLLAALCLVFAACNETKNNTERENQKGSFAINTIKVVDSIQYPAERLEEFGDWIDTDMAHFYAEMDLPVTNNAVLKQALENYLLDNVNNWSMSRDLDTNIEFGDGLSMLQDMKDDFFANEGPSAEYECYNKMIDSTDKYITYTLERMYYPAGAAHPGFTKSGETFNKETGKTFSWDMFTDKKMALEIIKHAIIEQYFEVDMEDFDEEDVYEYFDLAEYNGNGLELPASSPWIEKGKMYAWYQEYEVCNYSYGTPCCSLTYNEIKHILTDEGKAYFE